MFSFLGVFILTIIFFHNCFAKTIICDSFKNISISKNEFIFIETVNFPKNMTKEIRSECNFYVSAHSKNDTENMALIFIANNGELRNIRRGYVKRYDKKSSISFNSAEMSFYFTIDPYLNFSTISWAPFQGFITYETIFKNGCPLSGRTIKLSDETQIMYLQTFYNISDDSEAKKQCTWNFLCPKGYGFKFVVIDFEMNEEFKVVNSTNDLITSAEKLRAYYNRDNNITVHYNNPSNNKESNKSPFIAYVSIVKQNHPKTNLTCIFKQTPCPKISVYNSKNITEKSSCTKMKWSLPHNFTGYGYPNNAYCEKIIQLKPNQQLYAAVTYLHSEKYVDIVKYFNGSDDFVGARLEQKNVTVFFPHENDAIKEVKMRFESDGSIQGNGFSVEMEIFDCKCSDPNIVIPCEGTYNYSIMGSHTFQYCADLFCNFTVTVDPKCPEKYGLLKFNTRIYGLSAHFFVISNNETILNSTLAQRTALITPKSQTYFYIFTTKIHKLNSIKDKGFVQLIISADIGPERLPTIILTNEKPAYVLEFSQNNSAITVELSNDLKDANDVIETVHLPKTSAYPTMKCYTIYYYSNFTNVMGMLHFYRNGITSQLTVYKHHDCTNENITILFRSKYHHAKNCIFKETAFEIRAKQEQTASMIARNDGFCYFVIINQVVDNNNIIFTKLWTNSKKEAVEIFSGIHFSTKLLEFSHNTFLPWRTLILNRQFYIAVIPPNSSMMLKFYPYVIPFNITTKMVSLFNTPYHLYPNILMNLNLIYEIGNNDTSIQIDAIDIESTETLRMIDENGNNLTSLTTNFGISMLQETTVNLFYTQLNWHYKDFNDSFLYFKVSHNQNKKVL